MTVATNDELGEILADAEGRTLYLFEQDEGMTTACTGPCADNWPPLDAADPTAGEGVDQSLLETAATEIGENHVAYNGHLLYYFAGDTAPGDINGHGLPGWYRSDAGRRGSRRGVGLDLRPGVRLLTGPARSMAFGLGKRKRHHHGRPPSLPCPTKALMAGVAAGDEPALHEFIDRFQRRVYGAALAIVRDQALADEVTQDTFMRVWRRAESFDPRRGTRHRLADEGHPQHRRRRASACRRPTAIDPIDLLALQDESPGRRRRQSGDLRRARAAGTLPVEQARALLMAGCYGYTAGEISDIEQIPLGTAKTRIRLGLGKLRAAMNEVAEEQR